MTPPTTSAGTDRLTIVRLPEPSDAETFAEAVRRGLSARPRRLPCRYFYDEAGSQLFERICALPEYYLTRTEDAILRRHAVELAEVVELLPADCLVAGCGRRDGLVVTTGPSASSSPASPTAATRLRIGVGRVDGDRTRSRRLTGGLR